MGRKAGLSGAGGGGGRGSRDAAASAPVDWYRRQIGRQNSAKDKKILKQAKQEQEAKDRAPKAFRETFLILMSILGVLAAIYGILYYSLEK